MATLNRSGSAATSKLARRAPTLRLVSPTPRPPCAETVRFCEALLEAARNGVALGVAAVIAMKGRTYLVEACGDLRADPTYARGAVAALDDELRYLVNEASK